MLLEIRERTALFGIRYIPTKPNASNLALRAMNLTELSCQILMG